MNSNPMGSAADADAVARKRRAMAEALRSGNDVVVTPSGEVEFQSEAQEQGLTAIQVPNGKLAIHLCFSIPCHVRLKRSKAYAFEQSSVPRFSKSKEY